MNGQSLIPRSQCSEEFIQLLKLSSNTLSDDVDEVLSLYNLSASKLKESWHDYSIKKCSELTVFFGCNQPLFVSVK